MKSDLGKFEQQIKQTMGRAADLLLGYGWKVWFWGDSIGLEGLLDTSETLANSKYEAFVYGLMKAWIARRLPERPWDYTTPGVALLRLYQHNGDPVLLSAARLHADYLAGFRRSEGGAYVRFEDPGFDQRPELPRKEDDTVSALSLTKGGPCVFVDNMHFDGPFFSLLYKVTGDEQYRDMALANILPSIHLLFDRNEHLFHHFWSEKLKRPNGVFWGRGQGWGMLGIIHTLENLPHGDPATPELLAVLKAHCERMVKEQDPSGHWHTVIPDRDCYTESSVAAFVVDGFSRAIRAGWLDPSYRRVIDRAFEVLLERVTEIGKLDLVSYETYPSLHAGHYHLMPYGAMVPWGQGPLLAAMRSYVELLRTGAAHRGRGAE